jgi:hypothetical protein
VASTFDELLTACERTAFKLEFRDGYMIGDPGYQAWNAGDLDGAVDAYTGWTATARAATARGVRMLRVRVVSVPVSPYIAFEHAVTERVNISAGEAIRWLPRQKASDLCLPGNDVWIFDDKVVQFYFFAGDGAFVGDEVIAAPDVVKLCAGAFAAAWERATDHAEFGIS